MPNLAFSVHPSLDSLSFSPPPSPYCAFLFVLGFRFFSILRLCARTFLFPPELPLANGWRQIPKSDCPLSFFFLFCFVFDLFFGLFVSETIVQFSRFVVFLQRRKICLGEEQANESSFYGKNSKKN